MKIFCDFDGTIVDTIAAICSCYNEDFQYYKKFKYISPKQINTWDFQECNCATPEYINTYFNQQRFFDRLNFMPCAYEVLKNLAVNNDITIVSSGYSPNLKAKELWIKKYLPFCKFIGVNLKEYSDKSHVDMNDGIFIDDSAHNLMTSNAVDNICFGHDYEWNKRWDGVRCNDWIDINRYLIKLN